MGRTIVTRLDHGGRRLLPHGSARARFVAGASWSVVGAAASRGLTLFTMMLVARILKPHAFGELAMIQSTVGMFGLFAGLGLGLTATKYVAELRDADPGRAGRVLGLITGTSLVISSVMSVGLAGAARFLAGTVLDAPHLAVALGWGAVWLLFSTLNGVQSGALAGFEAFDVAAQINIAAGATACVVMLPAAWRWGTPGVIVAYGGVQAVNWLLNDRALRRACARWGIRIHIRDGWREWPILVHFSLPALCSSLVVVPAAWIANLLVVKHGGGYGELALFNAADQWRAALLFVPASVGPVLLAMLAHGQARNAANKRFVAMSMLVNALITGIPGVGVVVGAPWIMHAYGSEFRNGAPVLVWLALTAVLMAVANVVGHLIASRCSMWWGLALNTVWSMLFIAAAALLVPQQGARGLALAYLIAYVCHVLLSIGFVLVHERRSASSTKQNGTTDLIEATYER